jgi:polyisoprenoid-binding protein YceI
MSTWSIDSVHSEISFRVKHLMISTVSGKFGSFEATVESSSDTSFAGAKVSFSAEVDSISTGNEQRDGHLKSDDFFNASSFPKIVFSNGLLKEISEGSYKLIGELTLRDTTKSFEMNVSYSGMMTDSYGNQKAGFEATGTLSRKEFGLKWSATTEAGGVVVADEVKLILDIQLQKTA